MKKLLPAALAALCALALGPPAMAQVPVAYQAQSSNRTTNVPVTAANGLPVTCVSGCAGAGATPAGTNIIGKVGIDQTTPGTTNAVQATNLPATVDTNSGNKSASTLRVVLATDQPALTNAQPVAAQAATTGGASNYTFEVAASDNHQVIKNGAGTWYGFDAWSKHSAAMFIRFYDLGTGFNGCNSATGLIWEGAIPANSTPANAAGLVRPFDVGRNFSTGLAVCVTGAFGNTDTTSATASVASINVGYK